MYVWVGVLLPRKFEIEIREKCNECNKEVMLDDVAFQLPQHISLKISFDVDNYHPVISDIEAYATSLVPFYVKSKGIEISYNNLWVSFYESKELNEMHKYLDESLLNRHSIPIHPYDLGYIFHSTLYIDSNIKRLEEMKNKLIDYHFEEEILIDEIVIGLSETGLPGTFSILKYIKLNK